MQQFTLEKSKFFPYFAWTIIIGFAVFVGGVSIHISRTIQTIEQATLQTEASVNQTSLPLNN